MNKVCYICGHPIGPRQLYYKIGYNSYVCDEKWCYDQYVWDKYAARLAADTHHKYAIIDGTAYTIGSENDSPLGYCGRVFTIRFTDGTKVTTNSLWCQGEVPVKYHDTLKNNADFIFMEDI